MVLSDVTLDYFRQYGLIAIFTILAIAVPGGMLLLGFALSRLGLRPSKPSPIKLDIYECGMESIGGRWAQFDVKYYKYALLFVVFDIIAIFVYPWAVYLNNRSGLPRPGLFALVEMGIFLLVLAVGWAYAWRKRALEWE